MLAFSLSRRAILLLQRESCRWQNLTREKQALSALSMLFKPLMRRLRGSYRSNAGGVLAINPRFVERFLRITNVSKRCFLKYDFLMTCTLFSTGCAESIFIVDGNKLQRRASNVPIDGLSAFQVIYTESRNRFKLDISETREIHFL